MILTGSLNYGQLVNKQSPLNRGLGSRYLQLPMNRGGSRLLDIAAKNHGTIYGPTWQSASGRLGGYGSLFFDGVNDYVDLGSCPYVSERSVGCWHRANGDYTTFQPLIGSGSSGASNSNFVLDFGYTDGKYGFWPNAAVGPAITSTSAISDNSWRHVFATRSGVPGNWTLRLYVNGVKDAEAIGYTNDPFGAAQFVSIGRFGAYAGGFFCNGYLDDVVIYDRALSAAEVATLYNESRQFYPTLLNRVQMPMAVSAGGAVSQSIPAKMFDYRRRRAG